MTYERYETERKGFELKTSDSRNRWSRSHDIGQRGSSRPDERSGEAGNGKEELGSGGRCVRASFGRFWEASSSVRTEGVGARVV